MTPVRRKRIDIAFFPRILVPADDHGPAVLPQEQDALAFLHMEGQIFFDRQVPEGVMRSLRFPAEQSLCNHIQA